MNVISSGRPKRPSKLLDALRSRAQGGGSGHLGFGATHTEVKRRLILVASLSAFDKGALRAIAGAGADGIEVTIRGTQDLAALGALLPDMAIPVGIVLDAAESGEDLGSIIEAAGVDWIRLSLQSSALALAWEKTARFVTIPEDLELRRVPALNVLEVDAVVIEGSGLRKGGLRIEDALRLATLGELCKKPLFLDMGPGIAGEFFSVAQQCGMNGVFHTVEPETAADDVADYVKALEAQASTT